MSTRCESPWPAIDLAELRYCLAFGSSVEEMADFLHRDVEDVRHQIAVEAQRVASQRGRIRMPAGLQPGLDVSAAATVNAV
jgi:hypothetical protein